MDGLRGVAILLVVVNHAGPNLWPDAVLAGTGPYAVPFLRGLLGGGSVVLFFVLGGFIVAQGLLREHERGVLDPARFMLRRLVRLGVHLVPLALVMVLVQLVDPTAPGTMLNLVQNLGHMLTYTLNLVPVATELSYRGEIFHLWYLSVQQQCYLLLPLFVTVFARRRRAGVLVLAALVLAVYLNRQRVVEGADWVVASILTTTRSDGLIWGVLLAMMLPLLSRFRHWSTVLFASVLAMLACQLVLQELPEFAYLGPWSLLYQLAIGLAVVAVWLQARPSATSRALSWRPLQWLGHNSLTIYVWHLPVIVVVARHCSDLPWWVGTLVALAVQAVLTVVMSRLVEQPTRRLLAQHRWFRMRATAAA